MNEPAGDLAGRNIREEVINLSPVNEIRVSFDNELALAATAEANDTQGKSVNGPGSETLEPTIDENAGSPLSVGFGPTSLDEPPEHLDLATKLEMVAVQPTRSYSPKDPVARASAALKRKAGLEAMQNGDAATPPSRRRISANWRKLSVKKFPITKPVAKPVVDPDPEEPEPKHSLMDA